MKILEYKLGTIDINPQKIYFIGDDPYYASHLFVVDAHDNIVSIHVQSTYRHLKIVQKNHLDVTTIVGGGSCYVNPEHQLFVGDYSGDYGAISKDAALRFGELLAMTCRELKIPVKGLMAEPEEKRMNLFWK